MMIRQIEVIVEDWQLDCCGAPFEVGSTVTWQIHADAPDGSRDLPRFIEDHHDLAAQCIEVSGDVLEIVAMSNRLVGVPGSRSRTIDTSDVGDEQVEKAVRFHRAPDGFTPSGFRVRLVIDGETALPEYIEEPWVEERRKRDRILEETVTAYLNSDVGRRLTELRTRIAEEFSGRVEVRSERTGVTMQPLGSKRCVVMWMHSPEGISVFVGDGSWTLAATLLGVKELERFVTAASRGDVRERVLRGSFTTIVMEGDSEFARHEVEFTLKPGTLGYVPLTESDRRRRGDVDYEPW